MEISKHSKIIPSFCKSFFWDTEINNIDPQRDFIFVLERLLEFGDDRAIRWVLSWYSDDAIIETVKKSRKLSPKTANFWKNYYGLKEEEVQCLSKSFRKITESFWNS